MQGVAWPEAFAPLLREAHRRPVRPELRWLMELTGDGLQVFAPALLHKCSIPTRARRVAVRS